MNSAALWRLVTTCLRVSDLIYPPSKNIQLVGNYAGIICSLSSANGIAGIAPLNVEIGGQALPTLSR